MKLSPRVAAATAASALALAAPLTAALAFPTAAAAASPGQTRFSVTVTNVSKANMTMVQTAKGPMPIPLSPGAYAVYTGDNPVFKVGGTASKGLETVAEDGFPMALAQELKADSNVTDSGVFKQPAGPKPALLPGQSSQFTISAVPGDKLSFATMFVPSNDAFYGPADGIPLFQGTQPVSGDVTSQVAAYDAGTEVDQQFYGPATKPEQPRPNFGQSEMQPIQPVSANSGPNTYPATASVIKVTVNPLPSGGVAAGAGGTADAGNTAEIAGGVALIVAAGALVVWRRRTQRA